MKAIRRTSVNLGFNITRKSVLKLGILLMSFFMVFLFSTSSTNATTGGTAFAEGATLITNDNYADYFVSEDYVGYYGIGNGDQLFWFSEYVNGGKANAKAFLLNDVYLNGETFEFDAITGNYEGDGVREWAPIGDYYDKNGDGTKEGTTFVGVFDGCGYSVNGLYINNTSSIYAGLFGTVGSDAVIQNVTLTNSYVNAKNEIGGIVGALNGGAIIDCINEGVVFGKEDIGGICGFNNNGSLTNCLNKNAVSSSNGSYVGGVCGYNNGNVSACGNFGAVSGVSYVGGV